MQTHFHGSVFANTQIHFYVYTIVYIYIYIYINTHIYNLHGVKKHKT